MSHRQPRPSDVSGAGRTAGWNEPVRDGQSAEVGVLSDDRNDPMIGRVLRDTYRIVSSLDEGGMGKLYRAQHLRLNRPVAVKFMTRNLAANTEALARFRREAEIISQLDHPHIVHILDFDTTDDGDPYIVMELLMGVSLSQRLSAQVALTLRDSVEIALQTSSGLMLAHASGIVHRDLKPDNVFLLSMSDQRIFVKLLDFGISTGTTAGARLTGRYDVLGTPDYMAPEQARDTSKVDHRADQWSLACISYEMLTGSVPFPGESVVEVLYQVVNAAPRLLTEHAPGISDAVQQVVLRGLSKDPANRYSTIAEFAEDLARAAQIQPTSYGHLAESEQERLALGVSDQASADAGVNPRRAKTKREVSTRAAERTVNPRADDDAESRIPTPRVVVKPFANLVAGPDGAKNTSDAVQDISGSRDTGAATARKATTKSSKPRQLKEENHLTSVKPQRARLRAAAQASAHRESAAKVESGRLRRYSKPKMATGSPSSPSSGGPMRPAVHEGEKLPELPAIRMALDNARASIASGEDQRALENIRMALKIGQVDRSLSVQAILSGAADLMIPVLLRALGGPQRTLALSDLVPSAKDVSMKPQHMFLLSRIGSKTTIEELLDVTPLSATETLGILLDFRDLGYLTLR